ncbi:hypothetical protein A2Z67_02730 [Candidatus Woesebacteria bacterium RBG_13_36_22]|uniref:Uncharacterized protein n=1 Tax=Candidatus Woesebacteria bacterium RBG_13_36_22 TaxID=1802478 RepID=A0A1F7X833_9BACT|nr:MAG: hypothetical protein A2Z67_02730 [Candidatus Woesebacteria bacterium RBG_13_36_22]
MKIWGFIKEIFQQKAVCYKNVTIIINGKKVKRLSAQAVDEIDREFEEATKAMSKSVNNIFKIVKEEK